MKNYIIGGLIGVIAMYFLLGLSVGNLGASVAINNYDTTSYGFTASTSTINTTSTQVFATVARRSAIINTTASQITCSLDAANTTAVSSTVVAGRGVIIAPTSTGNLAPSATFGECRGEYNCYPHKGAVNCLAGAAITVDKLVQ